MIDKNELFKKSLYLFVFLNFFDLISTISLLNNGGIERNLMYYYAFSISILHFIIIKSMLVFSIYLTYKTFFRKYQEYTFYSLLIMNVLLLITVINNSFWWFMYVYN